MGCVKVIGQSVKEKIAAGDHLFNTALNLLVFEDSFVEQSNVYFNCGYRLILLGIFTN